MAYEKNEWKAREGTKLNKFTKSEETETTVVLTNTPEALAEPGTPFDTDKMNRIEEGIDGAHEAIAAEAQAREAAVDCAYEAIAAEAQAREAAVDGAYEAIAQEAQAREVAVNGAHEAIVAEAQARETAVEGAHEAIAAEGQNRQEAIENLLEMLRSLSPEEAANLAEALAAHKQAATLDHPDTSVTAAKLATNSVTAVKIASNAVTNAKIADNAVNTSKLADLSVTTNKIANLAVTSAKIADGAITQTKLPLYYRVEQNDNPYVNEFVLYTKRAQAALTLTGTYTGFFIGTNASSGNVNIATSSILSTSSRIRSFVNINPLTIAADWYGTIVAYRSA